MTGTYPTISGQNPRKKTPYFCTKSSNWNWHFLSTIWIFQANFSHRIDKFSFGELHGSIIQPLEGDEKFDYSANNKYQYFIEVCAIYFLLKFRFCKNGTKLEEITKFFFESGLLWVNYKVKAMRNFNFCWPFEIIQDLQLELLEFPFPEFLQTFCSERGIIFDLSILFFLWSLFWALFFSYSYKWTNDFVKFRT